MRCLTGVSCVKHEELGGWLISVCDGKVYVRKCGVGAACRVKGKAFWWVVGKQRLGVTAPCFYVINA